MRIISVAIFICSSLTITAQVNSNSSVQVKPKSELKSQRIDMEKIMKATEDAF